MSDCIQKGCIFLLHQIMGIYVCKVYRYTSCRIWRRRCQTDSVRCISDYDVKKGAGGILCLVPHVCKPPEILG